MSKITTQYQRGFTLLEGMVALTVLLSLLVLGAQHLNRQLTQRLHQAAADHLRSVATAVQHYACDHYDELDAALEPVLLSFERLKKYLPISFEPNNVYGQRYLIQITPPSSSPLSQEDAPAHSQLQLLVLTHEGQAIAESSLRQIAQQVGGGGGHLAIDVPVPHVANPTTVDRPEQPYIIGVYRSWQLEVPMQRDNQPLTTLGHLAYLSYLSPQEVMSANKLLHRKQNRWQPDGSTMETDLDLQAHTITFNDTGVTSTINAQGVTLDQQGTHIKLGLQQDNQAAGIELQRPGSRLRVDSERIAIESTVAVAQHWFTNQVQKHTAAELHRYWNKIPYYELLGSPDDQGLDHFAGQVCNRPAQDTVIDEDLAVATAGRLFLLGGQKSDRTILYLCGPAVAQNTSASSSSIAPASSPWRISSFGSEDKEQEHHKSHKSSSWSRFKQKLSKNAQ